MADAAAGLPASSDHAVKAHLHTLLRFGAGTSGAFVLCEAMGWNPTLLAPLLAAVLIANLPGALPLKGGLVLIAVQGVGAYGAYILTSLLLNTPFVLFGTIALILLICFANLAQGRGFLPILLLLISFATIPVITMIAPTQAAPLPLAYTRAMMVAVAAVWIVHVVWPKLEPGAAPAASSALATPVALALTGLAIVLPLMLLYLMYSITDALPVLITTIVLVINFDPKRGAMQALAMMLGNFVGGMIALAAYALLRIAPSLLTLMLISFLISLFFAARVAQGGPKGAVAVVTFNQTIVMLSLSLMPGGSTPGIWVTRLFQFAIACLFAVGMMSLLFPALQKRERRLAS